MPQSATPNYLGFDHIIYLVEDLDMAAKRFEALGFTLCDRDDADIAPHLHRLVCLQDGSFLEIVRFRDPTILRQHRFSALADSGGWVEYVLLIDDLAGAHASFTKAGLPASPIVKRKRPLVTGEEWEVWLSYFGRGADDPVLPMLAEDRTERTLRVPAHALRHANGATGVAGLTFVTADLSTARRKLGMFLPELSADRQMAQFRMKDSWIKLIQPEDPASPEGRRLAAVGPCIFSVTISGTKPGPLVLDNTV